MKRFIISVLVIIVTLIALLAGAAFAYSKTADYRGDILPDHLTINGVDCSGLSYGQAAAKLSDIWNSRHLIITGSLNEKLASYTDFGFEYDIADQISAVKKNNLLFSAANYYVNTPITATIPMIVCGNEASFRAQVADAPFLVRENTTKCQDAYVDLTDPDFSIVPEVYGTETDTEKLCRDLIEQIQLGENSFAFDERNYYSMPKVTTEDESLKEYQEFCRTYLTQRITYELGDESFTLTAETLASLMKDDRSGKADKKAVAAYIKKLAAEYDNVDTKRSFRSLTGKQVEVDGGLYGWQIDQEQETKKLISNINSHKDVSRKPAFSQEGYGEYARDMGDTYIDVDVSKQRVNYFIDGKLEFSEDCVTGNRATGTLTNIGAFYVINKIQNVVLRGHNADGSEYESPVQYWLGINWSSEGLHDANWRRTFGGDIWTYDGSHGCINMPPSRMPELYDMAEVGVPVIVHY